MVKNVLLFEFRSENIAMAELSLDRLRVQSIMGGEIRRVTDSVRPARVKSRHLLFAAHTLQF